MPASRQPGARRHCPHDFPSPLPLPEKEPSTVANFGHPPREGTGVPQFPATPAQTTATAGRPKSLEVNTWARARSRGGITPCQLVPRRVSACHLARTRRQGTTPRTVFEREAPRAPPPSRSPSPRRSSYLDSGPGPRPYSAQRFSFSFSAQRYSDFGARASYGQYGIERADRIRVRVRERERVKITPFLGVSSTNKSGARRRLPSTQSSPLGPA